MAKTAKRKRAKPAAKGTAPEDGNPEDGGPDRSLHGAEKEKHRQGDAADKPRRSPRSVPPDAAHPPLRGEGRPALRHGPDFRILPPLHRPGGGRRGHAGGGRRQRHPGHQLPRPRPHAGLRHGPQGGDGGAHGPARRLLEGQGRLHAHVQPGSQFLRRPRHRRRPGSHRHRIGAGAQVQPGRRRMPHLFRRRRRQPGTGLRVLQHGGPVEAAGDLRHREQPLRHGYVGGARLGQHRAVPPRPRLRHPRLSGQRHGRARRADRR